MNDACFGGVCSGEPLDADGDSFVSDLCDGDDCDDDNPDVNPGVTEASYGDPICEDGVDNDCDELFDMEDNGCRECIVPDDCDDGNPCTDDACVEYVCAITNNTVFCDDADECTMNDACSGGVCSGEPLDADGDSFVSGFCGGDDCDDDNPEVNPGVVEGPEGEGTCSDGLDNDCDGETDSLDPDCTSTGAIVSNHTAAAAFSSVPPAYVQQAKAAFRMAYGHTSHGSQIVTGMDLLKGESGSLYWFDSDGSAGGLSLHDRVPAGDLGNPDRVTWAQRTRDLLDAPGNDRNLILWSWCGQVSSAAEADIDTYLSLMSGLEADYPGVTFIYMTGHLEGTGESGNLHLRNEQIRAYCLANDKVLFDFADIESYDPDGSYFLDRGADDTCDYDSGNWATEWCAGHPGECASCYCSHSQCLNCQLKGKAFWWMMARLAGWSGQ